MNRNELLNLMNGHEVSSLRHEGVVAIDKKNDCLWCNGKKLKASLSALKYLYNRMLKGY